MITVEVCIKPIDNIPIVNTTAELVKTLRRTIGTFMITIIAKGNKIIFNVPEKIYEQNPNFFCEEGLIKLTESYYKDLEKQCHNN